MGDLRRAVVNLLDMFHARRLHQVQFEVPIRQLWYKHELLHLTVVLVEIRLQAFLLDAPGMLLLVDTAQNRLVRPLQVRPRRFERLHNGVACCL